MTPFEMLFGATGSFEMLVDAKDQKDLEEILDVIAVEKEFFDELPGYDALFGVCWNLEVPHLFRVLVGRLLIATVAYVALEKPLPYPKWVRAHLQLLVDQAPLNLEDLESDIQKVHDHQEFVGRLEAAEGL